MFHVGSCGDLRSESHRFRVMQSCVATQDVLQERVRRGFVLRTSTLGDVSRETLYRTDAQSERKRHSTARHSTASATMYKPSLNPLRESAQPNVLQDERRPSLSKADAVNQRKKERAEREKEHNHMSELLAKRLQSIEVRQAGLDEQAFLQRVNAREALDADAALAACLAEEDVDGAYDAGDDLARQLQAQETASALEEAEPSLAAVENALAMDRVNIEVARSLLDAEVASLEAEQMELALAASLRDTLKSNTKINRFAWTRKFFTFSRKWRHTCECWLLTVSVVSNGRSSVRLASRDACRHSDDADSSAKNK